MIEQYIAAGISKFAVRPAAPPASLDEFLDTFTRELTHCRTDRPGVTVGQRDVDDGHVQYDHQLGGRDDQQCHAKVAIVPGAGTVHTDTPEEFTGAPGVLAGGWTIGATAPSPRHAGDRPDRRVA